MSPKNTANFSASLSRRDFLKAAGAAIVAMTLSKPSYAFAKSTRSVLPQSSVWFYETPYINERGQPVIPRTVKIGQDDLVLTSTIEVPCVIKRVKESGTVNFTPEGIQFSGGGYLATVPFGSKNEPTCISLREQFSQLGYELDPVILISGTCSYFQVESSTAENFPLFAPTIEDHVCVPCMGIVNLNALKTKTKPKPQIRYRSVSGTMSLSDPFDPSLANGRLSVTQVTQPNISQPGFPGEFGANYWTGTVESPTLVSNDPNPDLWVRPLELDTTQPDAFTIGYCPWLDLGYAEGWLRKLYIDPNACFFDD